MVAARAMNETILEPDSSWLEFLDNTSRTSHNFWFLSGLINDGRRFGFEKNSKTHFGLIDYDTMMWIVKRFEGKNPDSKLIENVSEFAHELIFEFAFRTGVVARSNEYFSPDFIAKFAEYKQSFLDAINTATEDELETWVRRIVFGINGAKPFYKNNENWERTATDIYESLPPKGENNLQAISILNNISQEFSKLHSIKDFTTLQSFLRDAKNKKLYALLIKIHDGWRETTIGKDVYDEKNINTTRENQLVEISLNNIRQLIFHDINYLERKLNKKPDDDGLVVDQQLYETIYGQINEKRKTLQQLPEVSAKYTFDFMISVGIMLEDMIKELSKQKFSPIDTLTKIRNNLLQELFKDANIDLIDSIINYYND